MSQRIFISSVQREFAKERKALTEYVRKDAILGRFFDVFLFEEVPAQERKADGVYKGYIEKSGTGDMIAKCASWGVPAPEWYEDDPDDFRVVLKRPVSETNVEKTMVKTRGETGVKSSVKSSVKKLSSAEKILAYLRTTPTASAHELSIVVNLTVRAVEKNLRALRESGRLRRVGPDKGGHWEVIG